MICNFLADKSDRLDETLTLVCVCEGVASQYCYDNGRVCIEILPECGGVVRDWFGSKRLGSR